MAEQKNTPPKDTAAPMTKYVAIAARTDQEGVPWNGYWWLGCHWPVGVHEVRVVADAHPELLAERKAYAETDPSALYTKQQAEERGDADLAGKFRPWSCLTQKEVDSVITEPKHCLKVVDRANDPRILVFPVDSTTAPTKTPAEKAEERLAAARGAAAAG